MAADAEAVTDDELLTAPDGLIRADMNRPMSCVYSRKMRCRVLLHDILRPLLWIRLEASPEVVRMNFMVPKLPLAIDGKVKNISPAAASLDRSGSISIHEFLEYNGANLPEAASSYMTTPLRAWAERRGFRHVSWSRELLEGDSSCLHNSTALLLRVCIPGETSDPQLETRLVSHLEARRKTTYGAILRHFAQEDPDELLLSLATLILEERIYSDLAKLELSPATELSAHRYVI